jgi:lysophospholipase L1-like esterase
VLAALSVLVVSGLAELLPGLDPLRVLSAKKPSAPLTLAAKEAAPIDVGEAELRGETRGNPELVPGRSKRTSPGPLPEPDANWTSLEETEPKVPIIDERGNALSGFFRALERTRRKEPGAITRIVHFGDSIVASDYVSGTLRRKLQQRFGDAGHGFTLIANAWPAYFHNDIERYATVGWKVSRVVGPLAQDGYYGLGGVSFRAERHALARFGTVKKGDFGRSVSKFIVSYLAGPGDGAFQISVDGKPEALVETQAELKTSKFYEISVPDGPHEFEILTKRGMSRLFGVILERDAPGVVLDAIGIQGARIRFLDKQDDAHWAEQLRARNPDLVIYQFGANESADGILYPMPEYHDTMRKVMEQSRRALPNAGCLVIGVMDRAEKRGEEISSVRIIPELVEEQRKVAEEVGCAFFDTHRAMGGKGSMPIWVRRGLGQADMTHPSSVGADIIGTWVYRALLKTYREAAGALTSPDAKSPNTASDTSSPSRR